MEDLFVPSLLHRNTKIGCFTAFLKKSKDVNLCWKLSHVVEISISERAALFPVAQSTSPPKLPTHLASADARSNSSIIRLPMMK